MLCHQGIFVSNQTGYIIFMWCLSLIREGDNHYARSVSVSDTGAVTQADERSISDQYSSDRPGYIT